MRKGEAKKRFLTGRSAFRYVEDGFNIYSGIGLAYGRLKNREEARRWLEKALELYPGNLFVRGEYRKLGNQGK